MSHHKGVLELWLEFGGDIVVPMGGGYVPPYMLYEARSEPDCLNMLDVGKMKGITTREA